MSISLSIFGAIIILLYILFIIRLLRRKRLALKYSLLWLFSGIIMMIVVIFPDIINFGASILGIEVATNGLFATCIFLEIIILISLTTVISDFSIKIKRLIQHIAILENRIRKLEEGVKEEIDEEEVERG